MNRRSLLVAVPVAALVLGIVVWLGLPGGLRLLGLHPHYEIPPYDLTGQRALVIATSHDTLGETGDATGVFGSELTVPYYAFLDAGMTVDIASPQGGVVPVEPGSMGWPLATEADARFVADPAAMAKLQGSLRIGDLSGAEYDIVFLAGGWGAAYDLGQHPDVGVLITEANASAAVIGGVCHGPLGLLQAKDVDGTPLVEGRRVSAVTDAQVQQLGIGITPLHPETELRKAGAHFESETAFRDFFATHVAVDGNLVTGQNQNSGAETAHRMLELLVSR